MNNRIEFVEDSALKNIVGVGSGSSFIKLSLTNSRQGVTFSIKVGPISVPGPVQIGNNYYQAGLKINFTQSITF
ncbi:MAG TPA: hypothetical protein VHE99_07905 [Gammaproteobacteria bacterium]|nr:hypothetical protein [Gammaproteobacteria bacterium]